MTSVSASISGSWRVSSANAPWHRSLSQRFESEFANSSRRNLDDETDMSRMRQASASLPDATLSRMHPATGASHHRPTHQEISFMRTKTDLPGMYRVPA